jgi:dihydrofolate synthase / folylpolyglutamate synthase
MTYPESIEWLFSTQWFGIKLGLDAPRQLLAETMAYPGTDVKVVHVAGTNGKGSTCAMIASITRAAGRRTALFTSPHLVDFRERICVDGQMIPPADCARLLTQLRSVCEGMAPHPTFFEITFALAMRWFREEECEWLILETGMGGRHDATTAVPADVCVVTPIGIDHSEWLGATLEEIAHEKAGIFLPDIPAVSAPQELTAARALERVARALPTPLEFVENPWQEGPIALKGGHQAWNAALAIQALQKAGLELQPDIIRRGLARIDWPGRFERIGPRTVLDGAHNPHAARVLAEAWRSEFGSQRGALVFGTASGKDITGILDHLAPLAAHLYLCPIQTPRAIPAEEIAQSLPDTSSPHTCHACFADAYTAAAASGLPILVAGSLFLIGEARAHLTGMPFQASSQ